MVQYLAVPTGQTSKIQSVNTGYDGIGPGGRLAEHDPCLNIHNSCVRAATQALDPLSDFGERWMAIQAVDAQR